MLAQVEGIRAAAKEELEAQRKYVETARLKLEARGILAQLQAELSGSEGLLGNGANGHTPNSKIPEEWDELNRAEPASNQEEDSSGVETQRPDEEKKAPRASGSSGAKG